MDRITLDGHNGQKSNCLLISGFRGYLCLQHWRRQVPGRSQQRSPEDGFSFLPHGRGPPTYPLYDKSRRTRTLFEGILLGFTRTSPSVTPLSRTASSTSGVMLIKALRDGILNQSSLRYDFIFSSKNFLRLKTFPLDIVLPGYYPHRRRCVCVMNGSYPSRPGSCPHE